MSQKFTYSPEELARYARQRELEAVYIDTPLNRTGLRVLALAERLDRLLDQMEQDDDNLFVVGLVDAGLIPSTEDAYADMQACELIDAARTLAAEAAGFRWALSHFTGALRMDLHERPRSRRRREFAEVRETEADTAEVREASEQ